MVEEVPKLIAKIPGLRLKRTDCVFGVLLEFCICMPDSYIKDQIENSLVVRGKEETIKRSDTTLGGKGLERMK